MDEKWILNEKIDIKNPLNPLNSLFEKQQVHKWKKFKVNIFGLKNFENYRVCHLWLGLVFVF